MNRHICEEHATHNKQTKQRRRVQQAARKKVWKAAHQDTELRACGLRGLLEVTECRVLCPARRSENFAATKSGLVKFGFTKIKRDFGWDFVTGASMPLHIPHQKRPFKCLIPKSKLEHIWFEQYFLPAAISRLDENCNLQTIVLCEDDCAPRSRASFKGLLKEIAEVSPSALWCGYSRQGGEPRYGSHCLAITRQSAACILQYSRSLAGKTDVYAHYQGLDTFIHHVMKVATPTLTSGDQHVFQSTIA